MPQFIFTELPIHVKTEQHAPTVCSHLTFKPVVFVFQWGLLKKQDLLNPKNKKKSKTKARAKGLQTCKNSGNCQQSWNMNELYIHPELTMNLFQPSSTDPVNNTVQGGLNMSSETGRITSIRCEWATAAEEIVISAVQCEQSFTDRNTTRCFAVCPLPQHSGNNFGCLAFPFACGKTVSVLLFCGLRSLEKLSEGYTSFFLDLYIYIVPLTGFKGLKCSDSRQD